MLVICGLFNNFGSWSNNVKSMEDEGVLFLFRLPLGLFYSLGICSLLPMSTVLGS